MGKRLVLSAAHTKMSPGEEANGLREADLTRKIVQLMVPHLEKEKIEHKVVPLDLMLLKRIDWINDTGFDEEHDDIMVEIHVNDGGDRGIEGWFSEKADKYNRSQILTEFLLDEICKDTGYKNQQAKSELDHELGSLLILNQTDQISTALELLYIDNEEDVKILKDEKKLDELAKSIVTAIKKYFDSDKSNPIPGAPKKEKKKKNPFGSFGSGGFGGFGGGGGLPNFGGGASKDPFGNDENDSSSSSSGSGKMMDRDEREKMIKETYKKLLGKEPKQSDVNYFLNTGISEDDLIKRIFKSKDHKQLVEDAKEAADIKKKEAENKAEEEKMKAQVQDLQNINQNLNNLLQYKNHQIAQMQSVLRSHGIIQNGEYFDYNNPGRYAGQQGQPPQQGQAPRR